MKIIGATNGGLILEASRDEVARLIGFYYEGASGCTRLQVGAEIKVDAMYQQLYQLRNRADELSKTALVLRTCADLIEVQCPVVFPEEKAETT